MWVEAFHVIKRVLYSGTPTFTEIGFPALKRS